jgi:hypothetical protein
MSLEFQNCHVQLCTTQSAEFWIGTRLLKTEQGCSGFDSTGMVEENFAYMTK